MTSKDYLFVYGTLRNGFNLELKDKVSDELKYIGKAKLEASLYNIGEYPGAVNDKSGKEIWGEIFTVMNPEIVFKVLDEYEGFDANNISESEFVREKSRVKLESGKFTNAWVYWYNYDPKGKEKIRFKDYLNYLKIKI